MTKRSRNPAHATPAGLNTHTVWPDPLSLATTHGISVPAGTEMFHFPAFPPHTLYIQVRVARHDSYGVSPFGHPRITVRLPTPRGLSQATTSFFGSWCQGIHPVPLKTSTTKITLKRCSRPLCSSQTTTPRPHPHPRTHPATTSTHPHNRSTRAPAPTRHSPRAARTGQDNTPDTHPTPGRHARDCSLRTQQCADTTTRTPDAPVPTTTPAPTPPTRKQETHARAGDSCTRRTPRTRPAWLTFHPKHRRPHQRRPHGLPRPTQHPSTTPGHPEQARCSLERR